MNTYNTVRGKVGGRCILIVSEKSVGGWGGERKALEPWK